MKAILIGGGSSVSEGIEKGLWDKLKVAKENGVEIWSLNFAYLTMPFPPTRELFLDKSFFENNMESLQLLNRTHGVRMHSKNRKMYIDIPEIEVFETTRNPYEFKHKIFTGKGGLTGFFALSIAFKEQFDEIFLLGYDFGSKGGEQDKKTHYYQNEAKNLHIQSGGIGNPSIYLNQRGSVKSNILDFELYKKDLTKIWNVSTISHISAFPIITYEEFFKKL